MDTLSSSVSTLKVPALHSTPREFYHFKSSNKSHQLPTHHQLSTSIPSYKTTSFTHSNLTASPFFFSSSQPLSLKPSPYIHRKAATGYAAALLDIAQCNSNSSLEVIQKDVQRLSNLLKKERIQALLLDQFVGDKEKGQLVEGMAKRGKFNRYLMGLLKMLIQRNKVGMLGEVLGEFERIYDELIGTKVVMVSSAKKMEEDELFGIAKRVQRDSGAVKVKVRSFIDERLPSFVA